MTPEHVSELQSILRFLRANAFEKSEATLILEVEGLMQLALAEKDEVEKQRQRRLAGPELELTSGNNPGGDADFSDGDTTTQSGPGAQTGFGLMSSPAAPNNNTRQSLGRFGSNVEKAHAAVLFEDARASQKSEIDADDENDDDDDCSLDTFATPIGEFFGDANLLQNHTEQETTNDSGKKKKVDSSGNSGKKTVDSDSDDDLGETQTRDAENENEHDVSFAGGVSVSPRHDRDADADDVPRTRADGKSRDGTTTETETETNYPYDEDEEREDEVRPDQYDCAVLYDQTFLGEPETETLKRTAADWQHLASDEYSDCEDCGFFYLQVPPGETTRFVRHEIEGGNAFGDGGDDLYAQTVTENAQSTHEGDESGEAVAPEKSGTDDDPAGADIPNASPPSTPDDAPGDGFVFDRSPLGSATPNSEQGVTGKTGKGKGMGWGGSEFGGDVDGDISVSASQNLSPLDLSPLPSPRASGLDAANLDSAANALRAWVLRGAGDGSEGTGAGDGADHDYVAGDTVGVDAGDTGDGTADGTVPGDTRDAIPDISTTWYDGDGGTEISARAPPASTQKQETLDDFESFTLTVVHKKQRTGFEARKDFLCEPGTLVAGRYRIKQVLGSAAFSTAVRATDEVRERDADEKKRYASSSGRGKQTDGVFDADAYTSSSSPCHDVCLKIVKNSKDFFDQSLDEVKLLKMINDSDPGDSNGIVKMVDFFYHKEHLFIVTELLGCNLYEHQKKNLTEMAEFRKQERSKRRSRRSGSFQTETRMGNQSDSFSDRSASASPSRSLRDSPGSGVSSPFQTSPSKEPPVSKHPPSNYFTLRALRSIAHQILTSLKFMHAKDLIHCDVKPENVVLRFGEVNAKNRKVKVIDLGSSCFTTDHLSSYVQSRSYRAPEVTLGAPYDQKVDIWSLGCVLCELWTGEVLLRNENAPSLLARIISIFGPLPLRLLRAGKRTREFVTASGVPYEKVGGGDRYGERYDERYEIVSQNGSHPDDPSSDDRSHETRRETSSYQILRPKRTSLAFRLGLPALGAAYPKKETNQIPAKTPFPLRLSVPSPGIEPGAADSEQTNDSRDTTASGSTKKPETKSSFASTTEEKDLFLEFLLATLQPDPKRRVTAAQALEHPWLCGFEFEDFDDCRDVPLSANSGVGVEVAGNTRERDILAQL